MILRVSVRGNLGDLTDEHDAVGGVPAGLEVVVVCGDERQALFFERSDHGPATLEEHGHEGGATHVNMFVVCNLIRR